MRLILFLYPSAGDTRAEEQHGFRWILLCRQRFSNILHHRSCNALFFSVGRHARPDVLVMTMIMDETAFAESPWCRFNRVVDGSPLEGGSMPVSQLAGDADSATAALTFPAR